MLKVMMVAMNFGGIPMFYYLMVASSKFSKI